MLADTSVKSIDGGSLSSSYVAPPSSAPSGVDETKFIQLQAPAFEIQQIIERLPQKELANILSKIAESCFGEKDGNENSAVSVLACAAAGWIAASQLNHEIGDRIHDELEHWLHANFCFGQKLVAHFHSSPAEAVSIILRSLALVHDKKISPECTVYVTPALTEEDPSYAIALKEWPCVSVLNLPHKRDGAVDPEALTAAIEKDKSEGRKPLLILASVGSGLAGVCDNINSLVTICRQNDIWLHLEGPRLARRIIRSLDESAPKIVMQLPDVRSLTLDLAAWLGYVGGPVLTIIRPPFTKPGAIADNKEASVSVEPAFDQSVSLINSTWPTYSGALYYWILLQHLGCSEIAFRLRLRLDLANRMTQELGKIDGMIVLNHEKVVVDEGPSDRIYTGREILGALAESLEKEANKPDQPIPIAVMFRYIGKQHGGVEAQHSPMPASRIDVLNQWLAESAGRSASNLYIGAINFRNLSWIRFAPFDVPMRADEEALKKECDAFITAVKRQVAALEATNDQRPRLASVLQMPQFVHSLQLVGLPNWAGLGAVRYCPSVQAKPDEPHRPKWTSDRVDSLNIEIVKRLRVTDTAFSLGRALAPLVMKPEEPSDENAEKSEEQSGGMSTVACVRFGLVTADTDVEHLCATVCKSGSEIAEEWFQLEHMAEVVRKGIEEASREIEQEHVTRVYQEGLLRQVPIVGGLLNWWSPPSPTKPISGRRLNLSSGRLSPTTASLNQPSPPASPTLNMHDQPHSQKLENEAIVTTDRQPLIGGEQEASQDSSQ